MAYATAHVGRSHIHQWTFTFTFTFSHLADAFIQSDLQGCIHILHFTLMVHCTSGAIMDMG